MAHNEPSHRDLRCLTFSLSTLHINLIPINTFVKNKADDKCRLTFGTERVKWGGSAVISEGIQFDQIAILILRIRLEQTMCTPRSDAADRGISSR